MAKSKQLTILGKEIKKQFKTALKETTIQLNEVLEYMYENAIEAFYESMTPKYYNRTGSTFYGSDLYDNENKISNPVIIGNEYIAQVTVSPSNIPGQPYYKGNQNRPDKNWVFERTYIEGIHGITPAERKAWGKNDYWDKKIRKKYKTSFMHWYYLKQMGWKFNQYKNVRFPKHGGIKHMPLESYTFVGSRNYVMRPSPSNLMWSAYSQFRKPQNVQIFFENNFIYMLSKGSKGG